jgi:hypothetical protein
MAPVKSRAIVLRSYKLGETSKLVVCYTRDYGKVVELVDRTIHERERDTDLFDHIERSLAEMDLVDEDELDQALWRFELSLAAALGYSPELSACVQCAAAGGPLAGFSPTLGGLICARCGALGSGIALTTVSVAEVLRLVAADVRSGSASGTGVRLTRAERDDVTRALHPRGRSGDVQSRDVPEMPGSGTLESGVRRAVQATEGRTVWEEPNPHAAVSAVPGSPQTGAG